MAEKWTGETQIGRWTVLDQSITKTNGEVAWLCRCSCGTERYVLERSLRYGGSASCGCLANERARSAVSHKLDGKVFGDLTVLHIASTQKKIWRYLLDLQMFLWERSRHPGNATC